MTPKPGACWVSLHGIDSKFTRWTKSITNKALSLPNPLPATIPRETHKAAFLSIDSIIAQLVNMPYPTRQEVYDIFKNLGEPPNGIEKFFTYFSPDVKMGGISETCDFSSLGNIFDPAATVKVSIFGYRDRSSHSEDVLGKPPSVASRCLKPQILACNTERQFIRMRA